MKKNVMKSVIKVVLGAMVVGVGCNIASPTVSYAENVRTVQNYSSNKLIDIVNPYIVETFNSYYIRDEKELLQKIGQTNLEIVKQRLVVANKEKRAALQRDAVTLDHINILRAAGIDITSHWWGKRIKTYSQRDANVVRRMASIFSSKASGNASAASVLGFLSGLVPGYQLPSILASISSLVMGADADTWDKVQDLVTEEVIYGNYNLTIDINAWNTEVKVY